MGPDKDSLSIWAQTWTLMKNTFRQTDWWLNSSIGLWNELREWEKGAPAYNRFKLSVSRAKSFEIHVRRPYQNRRAMKDLPALPYTIAWGKTFSGWFRTRTLWIEKNIKTKWPIKQSNIPKWSLQQLVFSTMSFSSNRFQPDDGTSTAEKVM